MKIITVSSSVACRPFEVNSVQVKKTGLAFIQKSNLVELEVLVDSRVGEPFYKGDRVLVRADRYATAWAKDRLTAPHINGEFILVPEDEIIMRVCKEPIGSMPIGCKNPAEVFDYGLEQDLKKACE